MSDDRANYQTNACSAERMSAIAVGQPTMSSTRRLAARSAASDHREAEHARNRTLPASRASRRRRPADPKVPGGPAILSFVEAPGRPAPRAPGRTRPA